MYDKNILSLCTSQHMYNVIYNVIYLSVWCPDKGVLLEQLYQSHLSLQQSKPHPNAVAWAETKWNVSKLWPLGSLLWGKPIQKKELSSMVYSYSLSQSRFNNILTKLQ